MAFYGSIRMSCHASLSLPVVSKGRGGMEEKSTLNLGNVGPNASNTQ